MNPRELLAQYSTQASVRATTYPTITELLADIAQDLPTTHTDAWRISKINDCLSQVWKWIASTASVTTTLTSGQVVYPLTSDGRFESIKSVLVSDSTIANPDTTAVWTEYTQAAEGDSLAPYTYFKALNGIGVYPVPTSDESHHGLKVVYHPSPPRYSTGTLTTVPQLAPDYLSGVKSFVKAEIAKSGAEPDVDLANNHTADWMVALSKMRHDFYQRQAVNKPQKFNYRSKWNRG